MCITYNLCVRVCVCVHIMSVVCDLHSGWAQQEAWHCIVISIVPKGTH